MYRTHHCGALRISDIGKQVKLSGWVQANRDFGAMTFVDLRDRYGITQLVFSMEEDRQICESARKLGREFVIMVEGKVRERTNKNPNRDTGDIEIQVSAFQILNASKVPPFTIEDETDGGDDIRMKYRYLDLRRNQVQKNILFRSKLALETRKYLAELNFAEIETPFLIKSTPEGARDFVVPSRMNPGQFYALPQSPQTFKQILMVAGYDRYFQIVKCFRDEDLRADRQPEFTQIDCEMAFVTQEEVLNTFEGLTKHLFNQTLGIALGDFPRMNYDDAMRLYGSDKPDLRFDMSFVTLNELVKNKGFAVFDEAELIIGIKVPGKADMTRKQTDELTEWVKRPQIGAKGLVTVRFQEDGIKSSVDKFFQQEDIKQWLDLFGAVPGDLLLILSGEKDQVRKQLGELRLEMGRRLDLMTKGVFKPLWVLDFPLLEWDDDTARFYAMHHPFTSPKKEQIADMGSEDREVLKNLRADAYDLVINGVEIGALQSKNFNLLGFTPEEAENQFGFLLGAFEYGAPPHGGIAFGFDRLCAVLNGQNSIRDFIAFPKNNQGRDMMIDAPSELAPLQLDELSLQLNVKS
jgi:aspartyl-tRNA synthetase